MSKLFIGYIVLCLLDLKLAWLLLIGQGITTLNKVCVMLLQVKVVHHWNILDIMNPPVSETNK